MTVVSSQAHAKMRSRLRRWGVPLGALAVVLFGPGLYDLTRMSLMERRMDRRLASLKTQEEQLRKERDRLEHDPTYVEGLIRSTFKVAKPGEVVVPLDRSDRR